jgi:L-iditol 2-dehydrogenase
MLVSFPQRLIPRMLFIINGLHPSCIQVSSTSPKRMNAAVFLGPNKISTRRVTLSDNKPIESTILLRVRACAVCGYDVRVFRNGHEKVTPPIILGHEICAETIDDLKLPNEKIIGADSRVAISPLIPCLRCAYCSNRQFNLCSELREIGSSINGGFAEYIQVPRTTLQVGGIIPIPNALRDEEASLLEPLSCCINGLSRVDTHNLGEEYSVCIIGDGPVGLIHLKLLNLMGIRSIVIGKIESRMKAAKSMGAGAVLFANDNFESTIKEVFDLTRGIGANLVIIAASNPSALALATKISSKNAQISLFAGMPRGTPFTLDANWLHYNQLSIIGNFSATPNSIRQAINLVSGNQINLSEVISHCYSLFDIEKAFAATENYHGLRNVINKF